MGNQTSNTIELKKWIWQSYLKSALIPIVMIELLFFCINFFANRYYQQMLVNASVVSEGNFIAEINRVNQNLTVTGIFILIALLSFYGLFFYILYKRSRKMSLSLSYPLLAINEMVHSIGGGEYYQKKPEFHVRELDETAMHLIDMGEQLGEANRSLLDAQEKLKERESYLQAVMNSIDDVIIEVDGDGILRNVLALDPELYAKNHVFGENVSVYSIMSREKADLYLNTIREVISTGVTQSIEYELETSAGMRWFQARISHIHGSGSAVVSARNITGRKEMERSIMMARDEAQKASQAKTQFLSNMSHELRTPLNAVLGFAQVLELDSTAPLTESQSECVHEIEEAGRRLLELINKVLDLSKIESGKINISLQPLPVSVLMEETLSLIKPMADRYGVRIDSHMTRCRDCYVLADKNRLKQVLTNLLSNAIKYNKPRGSVDYYCELQEGVMRFHVIDTGIGIPREEQEMVFQPFYRLHPDKSLIEGTGIGLPMARQLTEMMGGQVIFDSEAGLGSHFTIELPAADTGAAFGRDADLFPVTPSQNKDVQLILYIEDNPSNLALVERLTKNIPRTRLISAETAELGIDLARAHQPDLILLDINLPDMDGYEIMKRLRGYKETSHIPVIAVSANPMEQDIESALAAGFTDYIAKPINVMEFIRKLGRLLN